MKNKTRRRILLIVAVFALTNLTINGQEINNDSIPQKDSIVGFSLEELKNYAVEHSYDIKNADLEIQKSKALRWEYTAVGLPQVNGQINFQTFPLIPTTLIPGDFIAPPGATGPFEPLEVQFGSKQNADWGITVNQLIFSGEYIVGLKASKIYLELSKKSKEKSIITVKENIEKTYYLILITEESISVLDSVFKTSSSLLAENEKLLEAGFMEDTDVEQLRLNLKTTESSIVSFQKQREVLYRLLKFQSGIDYSQMLKLSGNLDDALAEIEENSLFPEDYSLYKNIDYQLVEVNENLSDLLLQREKTKYLPSLSAFYSYKESFMNDSLNFFANDAPWYGTSVWGLQLSIPIFSSGIRYSKVKQAKVDLLQKKNIKSQTEQALMLEYEQTVSDFLISVNNVRNASEQRHLAKKIYDNSQKKFKLGMEQSFMLTQYQSQYFMALTNYYQALNELIDKNITLKRLMNML